MQDTKKIAPEMAQAEMERWLDFKKVSDKKRELYKDAIENLTGAITDGRVSIEDDNRITHRLLFPVLDKNDYPLLETLEYKARMTVGGVTQYTKNLKPGDSDGRIMAYVAALTGTAVGVLAKMDTEDNTIAQSVAVFFL